MTLPAPPASAPALPPDLSRTTIAAATLRPPTGSGIWRTLWPLLLAIAIALFAYRWVGPRVGGYGTNLMIDCGTAIVLAVSLQIVNGFTGQFSIGHAGFQSLGGYAAAAIVYYGSLRIWGDSNFHGGWLSSGIPSQGHLLQAGDALFIAACLFGAVVAAAVGWVVGLPSLRLRGDYLAIVTLGFGEIVRVILQGTPDQLDPTSTDPSLADLSFPRQLTHLGGALGFSGAPTYTTLFWVMLVVVLTLAATIRLKYSAYGRALLSIREDDIAAQAVGVNVTKLKVRAFVLSAFFAGLAGGLYAMQSGTINAADFGFQRSFNLVIMVVLGGLGSISGATIAAVILTLLPELLRDPPSLMPYGLIGAAILAILILLLAPRRTGPLLTLIGVCAGWQAMRWISHRLGIDLSQYRMILYALALIVIMIVRPRGLFGMREVWEYWPRWARWRTAI